jgi:N-formylglutamate amidohydrolase
MPPVSAPTPPFERHGPAQAQSPLVCSVPHAGRHYPPELLAASRVAPVILEQLEDRYADLLVRQLQDDGAIVIVARVARAWIDLNRGPDDLDVRLHGNVASPRPSVRARAGLGLFPRRVGRHDLWRSSLSPEEAQARIGRVHEPYHSAIDQALRCARERFGYAVLLDCHSMPPLRGGDAAQIVVGDLHRRAAGAGLAAHVAAIGHAAGHRTAVNAPYAGAYTLARHGRPAQEIHALQVEIDRSLYLAPDLREPGGGLQRTRELVARLARAAIDGARPEIAVAAE